MGPEGAVVAWVEPESSAQKAGLLIGDRILTVQGKETTGLELNAVLDLIAVSFRKLPTI